MVMPNEPRSSVARSFCAYRAANTICGTSYGRFSICAVIPVSSRHIRVCPICWLVVGWRTADAFVPENRRAVRTFAARVALGRIDVLCEAQGESVLGCEELPFHAQSMSKVKVRCTRCVGVTNHIVMHNVSEKGRDDESGIQWNETYQMIRCQGCDQVSFRQEFYSSEDFDPNTGELEVSETLYPERLSGRNPIDGHEYFPSRTRQVYREVLKAMNSGAPILAAIGLRAIIESVCADQKVPGSNLEKRIDALAKNGSLSGLQAEFLHRHRFLGNTAAHEVVAPKPTELVAALDIAETLLKTIYVLPDVALSISTGVKPRQSAGVSASSASTASAPNAAKPAAMPGASSKPKV
jgi:hypothetical protein